MKTLKPLVLMIIVFFIFSGSLHAQIAKRPHKKDTTYMDAGNIIMAYPFSFFFSSLKVGYEFRTGYKKSAKFLFNYTSRDNVDHYVSKFSEFGVEAQLKFYFSHEKVDLSGFYAAPFVQYYSCNFKAGGNNSSASTFGVGYLFGYQRVYGSGVALDIYLGGNLNSPSGAGASIIAGDDNSSFSIYKHGISPHMDIGVGLGF